RRRPPRRARRRRKRVRSRYPLSNCSIHGISGIRGLNKPPIFLRAKAVELIREFGFPQAVPLLFHGGIYNFIYFAHVPFARPSRAPRTRSGERVGPRNAPHRGSRSRLERGCRADLPRSSPD